MDNSTQTFRMKLATYRRIRKIFKAKYKETVAHYFERLSHELDDLAHDAMTDIQFKYGDIPDAAI